MRAGANLQGPVRNADARSARARQGRVKIEARAGAAALDIFPNFRAVGRYAQAKSRRLSLSEARRRACPGGIPATPPQQSAWGALHVWQWRLLRRGGDKQARRTEQRRMRSAVSS